MELLIFFFFIPIARALIFFFDWRFMVKVCGRHHAYLAGSLDEEGEKKEDSIKAGEWITENLTEIKRRVKKAGLSNPVQNFMEAKGYGYVGEQRISTLDNLLYLDTKIQGQAVTILKRSRGHFKNQAIQSINPIFWLDILFFLPKAIVSASGIDTSSKLADVGLKITQIVYWLVILTAVILNPELITVLIETIKT